jgi:hypothetical protein
MIHSLGQGGAQPPLTSEHTGLLSQANAPLSFSAFPAPPFSTLGLSFQEHFLNSTPRRLAAGQPRTGNDERSPETEGQYGARERALDSVTVTQDLITVLPQIPSG